MNSSVVLLSGGTGSATAAFRERDETLLRPVYLDFGRPSAAAERRAAAALAERLNTTLQVLDLPHVAQIAAAGAGPSADAVKTAVARLGGPEETPGLSLVLLAVGAQYAAAIGADALISGQTAAPTGSGTGPLSRERTVEPRELHHAFGMVLEAALPAVRSVRLNRPLIDLQPFEVVKLARHLAVPLELTWSCHRKAPPCGTCQACKRRADAFSAAGLVDPLLANPIR